MLEKTITTEDNDVLFKHYSIILFGYSITCILSYMFFVIRGTGFHIYFHDSWIYTDMAKRIALNSSLKMDYVLNLIYPPLYPFIISFAYYFKSQETIFTAIKFINIMVYSTAFIPIFLILNKYSELSKKLAFVGAILLVINSWSYNCVADIASEALYCPLVAWFAWLFYEKSYLKNYLWVALFTLSMVTLPHVKALGTIIIPVFLATVVTIYILGIEKLNFSVFKILASVCISIIVQILYKMYIFSVVPLSQSDISGGYFFCLKNHNLSEIGYWLDRTWYSFFGLIIGTGTPAIAIALSIIITNYKVIYKDIFVIFTFYFFVATFIVVPIFTPGDSLGISHIRYYSPLIFLVMVILFKYHVFFSKKDFIIPLILIITNVCFGFKALPDSIINFMSSKFNFMLPSINLLLPLMFKAGVIIIFIVGVTLLYYYKERFVLIMFVFFVIALPMSFVMKGRSNLINFKSFYDKYGITEHILINSIINKQKKLVIDRDFNSTDFFTMAEYETIMINLPIVPQYYKANELLSSQKKNILFLTNKNIPTMKKVGSGKYINLYES